MDAPRAEPRLPCARASGRPVDPRRPTSGPALVGRSVNALAPRDVLSRRGSSVPPPPARRHARLLRDGGPAAGRLAGTPRRPPTSPRSRRSLGGQSHGRRLRRLAMPLAASSRTPPASCEEGVPCAGAGARRRGACARRTRRLLPLDAPRRISRDAVLLHELAHRRVLRLRVPRRLRPRPGTRRPAHRTVCRSPFLRHSTGGRCNRLGSAALRGIPLALPSAPPCCTPPPLRLCRGGRAPSPRRRNGHASPDRRPAPDPRPPRIPPRTRVGPRCDHPARRPSRSSRRRRALRPVARILAIPSLRTPPRKGRCPRRSASRARCRRNRLGRLVGRRQMDLRILSSAVRRSRLASSPLSRFHRSSPPRPALAVLSSKYDISDPDGSRRALLLALGLVPSPSPPRGFVLWTPSPSEQDL